MPFCILKGKRYEFMKVKKWLLGLIAFAAMVVLCAVCVGAETYEETDEVFYYKVLDDGTVCITNWGSYNYTEEVICEIPAVIDGKIVTTMDGGFFFDSTPPKYLLIPETVTYINEDMFVWTDGYITDITVSDNNKNYSSVDGVLYNKDKTELIYYPAGKYGDCVIPKSVKYIHDSAFRGSENITQVSVETGNNYYTVENGILFTKDKTKLVKYPCQLENTSYNVPDSVIDIGGWAFYGNGNISSINFTDSIKSIGECCFDKCYNIELTNIPRKIEYLGGYAFGGRLKAQTLIMPKTLSKLGLHAVAARVSRYAFYNCEIENVIYEDGTVALYSATVQYCNSLKSVTIPKSVTKICGNAYENLGFMYGQKIDNFKIYCYSGTAGEKYAKDNGFTYELLDKPTLSKVTDVKLGGRAADALRINWAKNASADGYIVEMYQGNKWVRVAKITNNGTTTFRKAGLKASSVYKFRVRAYKMSGKTAVYGAYSATVAARTNPSVIKGAKLTGRAADALRINWTKNTSADGYIVEMYKGGKWVRAAKITNNSTTTFRKAGLKASSVYKFRVRAYKMSGKTALYGNYSATVTARTNPSIVKGVKIGGKAKDALRVNWAKNASAQGYIVEMYKGGKWVRVAKITNGNTTTFRKAGLAKNTTYKFRVKAYYMSGKTALYGNYGSVSGKTAAK